MLRIACLALLLVACGSTSETKMKPPPRVVAQADGAQEVQVQQVDLAGLKAELVAKHGEAARARVERGVDQVAKLWRAEDGDLAAFVRAEFIADPGQLDAVFARLEQVFEQVDGHLHEVGRELRRASDVDVGPLLGVDPLLAAVDPGAHLTEDLFAAKAGFVVLLNFPLTTLAERDAGGAKTLANGERWHRDIRDGRRGRNRSGQPSGRDGGPWRGLRGLPQGLSQARISHPARRATDPARSQFRAWRTQSRQAHSFFAVFSMI